MIELKAEGIMKLETMAADPTRVDLHIIADFVSPGARVLDIGCGDGTLLELLEREKNVDGRGMEISQKGVNETVARGLSVVQGDADHLQIPGVITLQIGEHRHFLHAGGAPTGPEVQQQRLVIEVGGGHSRVAGIPQHEIRARSAE